MLHSVRVLQRVCVLQEEGAAPRAEPLRNPACKQCTGPAPTLLACRCCSVPAAATSCPTIWSCLKGLCGSCRRYAKAWSGVGEGGQIGWLGIGSSCTGGLRGCFVNCWLYHTILCWRATTRGMADHSWCSGTAPSLSCLHA